MMVAREPRDGRRVRWVRRGGWIPLMFLMAGLSLLLLAGGVCGKTVTVNDNAAPGGDGRARKE